MKRILMIKEITYHITLTRNSENGLWLAKTGSFIYGSPGSPYYAVRTLIDKLPDVKDDTRILLNSGGIAIGAFISMMAMLTCVMAYPIWIIVIPSTIIGLAGITLLSWSATR